MERALTYDTITGKSKWEGHSGSEFQFLEQVLFEEVGVAPANC